MVDTLDRDIEVEDVSMAIVRFRSGALGSIVNSVLSPRQETRLRFDFQQATVELTGLYSFGKKDWRHTPIEGTAEGALAHWKDVPDDQLEGHTAQVAALLDSMDRHERPRSSTTAHPGVHYLSVQVCGDRPDDPAGLHRFR